MTRVLCTAIPFVRLSVNTCCSHRQTKRQTIRTMLQYSDV